MRGSFLYNEEKEPGVCKICLCLEQSYGRGGFLLHRSGQSFYQRKNGKREQFHQSDDTQLYSTDGLAVCAADSVCAYAHLGRKASGYPGGI